MILAGIFPAVGAILATLPSAVLGGCTIMMFGTIVISGLQMIGKCGFSQRNITISALSLSIGLGFTQLPGLFAIFPSIVRSVFAKSYSLSKVYGFERDKTYKRWIAID